MGLISKDSTSPVICLTMLSGVLWTILLSNYCILMQSGLFVFSEEQDENLSPQELKKSAPALFLEDENSPVSSTQKKKSKKLRICEDGPSKAKKRLVDPVVQLGHELEASSPAPVALSQNDNVDEVFFI